MKTIRNSHELAALLTPEKDLIIDDDVLFEFSPQVGEIRDVRCRDLTLKKGSILLDFNCENFTGRNFTGGNFTGGNISYHCFFCARGWVKCKTIKGRRVPCAEPIALEGFKKA